MLEWHHHHHHHHQWRLWLEEAAFGLTDFPLTGEASRTTACADSGWDDRWGQVFKVMGFC